MVWRLYDDQYSNIKECPFEITDTKWYAVNVSLSTKDNTTWLQQMKSGFERIVWNKNLWKKATKQPQNKYHDCLIELFNCLVFKEYGISVFVWK